MNAVKSIRQTKSLELKLWRSNRSWIAASREDKQPAQQIKVDLSDYAEAIGSGRLSIMLSGSLRCSGIADAHCIVQFKDRGKNVLSSQVLTVVSSLEWQNFELNLIQPPVKTAHLEFTLTTVRCWISASGCTCAPLGQDKVTIHYDGLRMIAKFAGESSNHAAPRQSTVT